MKWQRVNMKLHFILLVVMQAREFTYYTTYENHQINAVDMNKVDLESNKLVRYTPITNQQINFQN